MYSLPTYKGRGIGMKLMEAIINFAEEKGIDVVWRRAEEKAESLYKRAGFRKKGKYMEYRT